MSQALPGYQVVVILRDRRVPAAAAGPDPAAAAAPVRGRRPLPQRSSHESCEEGLPPQPRSWPGPAVLKVRALGVCRRRRQYVRDW